MAEISSKPERPIEKKSDDSLSRGEFVKRLGTSLVSSSGKSTGIVIGLTGTWGSGKSSILNLLREHLKSQYPEILIVNFDPWLISGRDDLITQFLGQVIGTINSEPKLREKLKGISSALAKYGSQLSPIANLIKPGLGSILQGGFGLVERVLSGSKDLAQLRKALEGELEKVGVPVVVMIDELDRVEDQEVRAVAQLVRAVADFQSISYVLAFDAERVTEALGGEGDRAERLERGKAYLEKIVQLQIPVPITLEEEILNLIESGLLPILQELGLSAVALRDQRYRDVVAAITGGIIVTPRDVKRLVGTFHAVIGMVFGEVDWIDVFVYCVLLVKAPTTVDLLKKNYQFIVQGQISEASMRKRIDLDQDKLDERLKYILQNPSDEDLSRLLSFILPFASEKPNNSFDHQDSISSRRPMLTLLRFALPPSTVPRKEVESILGQTSGNLEESLKRIYREGKFEGFYDRFSSLYLSTEGLDELGFWGGVAGFLKKPNLSWLDSYSPMHEVARSFADLFETKIRQKPNFVSDATAIFQQFLKANEKELMPAWIRSHVFAHRLFGNSDGATDQAILSAKETTSSVDMLIPIWKAEHLEGQLLQSRWSLQPIYTMVDSGGWDAECKDLLCNWMSDDATTDAIAIFLFGAHYSTGRDMIEAFCGWDFLQSRAKQRLASQVELNPTARIALKKAAGDRSKG